MKTRYRVLPGTQIGEMIRETALWEWPLLTISLISNLFLALSEGITLIVIYQITSLLGSSNKLNFFHLPATFAPLVNGLAALSRGQQFILLLLIAIALQILTGLTRYVNGLAIGWFAARCQSWIRPKMHRHLDSLSEARILKTIDNVTQNMTVLSVAHRLSSVCHADEIVVLDGGHIKERGKHADLMQLECLYAALWKRQADQTMPS
jgi:hypothetical protein